tara:strand:- start:38939 stop:39358 length:420 start_codon:yes stop_codon:yes gene_type:complete
MNNETDSALTGSRLLHTMIRVRDLERSIDFYTKLLGMRLLRQNDYPTGKFSLAFLGYGNEEDTSVIELTYNWDQEEDYDIGNGFGHLAISVADAYTACEKLVDAGANVPRPAGPMKGGTTVIAFVEDPDGYKIELIQRS